MFMTALPGEDDGTGLTVAGGVVELQFYTGMTGRKERHNKADISNGVSYGQPSGAYVVSTFCHVSQRGFTEFSCAVSAGRRAGGAADDAVQQVERPTV